MDKVQGAPPLRAPIVVTISLVLMAMAWLGTGLPRATMSPLVSGAALAQAPLSRVDVAGWLVARGPAPGSPGVERIRLATTDGTHEIDVDTSTVLRDALGVPLLLSALLPGWSLRITGDVDADARIVAERIVAEPPAVASGLTAQSLRGRVLAALPGAALDGDNLLLVAAAEGVSTIEVGILAVLLDALGQPIAFPDLQAGHSVSATGLGLGLLSFQADAVTVLAPGRPTTVRVAGTLRARAVDGSGDERWIVGTSAVTVTQAVAAGTAAAVGERVDLRVERGSDGEMSATSVTIAALATERVELRGTVDAIDLDSVTVDGLALAIDGDTVLIGTVEAGVHVAVLARAEDGGVLVAERVEAQADGVVGVQFEGSIDLLGLLSWTVGGTTVHIDALGTVLTGLAPVLGLHAEVTGSLRPDGSVDAERIHVEINPLGGLQLLEGALVTVGPVPGTWQIEVIQVGGAASTLDLSVSASTVLDESRGSVRVGAEAQAHVRLGLGGILEADVIRIRR